ncbi:MAG: hypothetical protein IKX21_07370 [Deltaproteobacteria bacterium]|nr:hypothetical protein [Deltaproteobacteria bacterium]
MKRAVETIGEGSMLFGTYEDMVRVFGIIAPDIDVNALKENVDWRYVSVFMHPETGETRTVEDWGEEFDAEKMFEVEWAENGKWKAVGAQ